MAIPPNTKVSGILATRFMNRFGFVESKLKELSQKVRVLKDKEKILRSSSHNQMSYRDCRNCTHFVRVIGSEEDYDFLVSGFCKIGRLRGDFKLYDFDITSRSCPSFLLEPNNQKATILEHNLSKQLLITKEEAMKKVPHKSEDDEWIENMLQASQGSFYKFCKENNKELKQLDRIIGEEFDITKHIKLTDHLSSLSEEFLKRKKRGKVK